VTGGTLLCIELIGGNAKHVVALDAHAMQNRAGDRRKFWRALWSRRTGFGASGVCSHGPIV